ncbi:hypothetical protein [Microbacterium suaedae]|uniref:hypothetical protein n=1 Tax=Microbacterium suaedae TaxID=2067813 RepID=UPI000DAF2BF0|nr:hypothetical protein [Microbacterium suaedae]
MSAAGHDRTAVAPHKFATEAGATPHHEIRRLRVTPATADACRRHYPAFGWRILESASSGRRLVLSRPAEIRERDRLHVLEGELDDEIARMRRIARRGRLVSGVGGVVMFLVGVVLLTLAAPAFFGRDEAAFLACLGMGTAFCMVPPMFASLVRERIDDGARERLRLSHERADHLRVLAGQSLMRFRTGGAVVAS